MIENSKILLVDDEEDILEFLSYNLKKEGFRIDTANNGISALKKLEKSKPDLIILDVMMPEMDGIEVCEKIREQDKFDDVLILFLTARSEEYSELAGFSAGADDYITKPVKPKRIISKVKGLLRRSKKYSEKEVGEIVFGDLKINREKYKVYKSDVSISLPRKEFELLDLLASKPDKVFKREKIMEKVWGEQVVVGDRTIDVHIRKLRKKIGDKYFKTVKGVGYKFIIEE